MGNPTGFLKHSRELPATRPIEERLKDYREFIERYTDEALHQQSGRCMNCGVPFCHNGCPLGNLIPDFTDAVYRKQWKQAYEILISTNNFPEFTGRICPAPCETACVLGIHQPAVTIEEIEKHIIEIAFEHGLVKPQIPSQRTGKSVAIVGSGPAGLAAAAQLNAAGHTVTVYERDDAPGGLLRYGIPDFKLEKWVVDRRIKILEAEGIQFHCGVNVGYHLHASDIIEQFDAIVLAGGSTIPRDLDIPGRSLQGVHFAMDYLTQQNKRISSKAVSADDILATGKHVVVIGGGDTGSDCVGTANRQEALSVTQFELLPMPPQGRTPFMPWPTYPMILRTSSSQAEGVERKWAISTKAFLDDGNEHLGGLRVVNLEWQVTSDGRPAHFVEIPGSERDIPCELALLAMGFVHPQHEGIVGQLDIALDDLGNVKASEEHFETNIPKVFAAGDMRRGQSLVVWAMSEGRECARKVDEFLSGISVLESKDVRVSGHRA